MFYIRLFSFLIRDKFIIVMSDIVNAFKNGQFNSNLIANYLQVGTKKI